MVMNGSCRSVGAKDRPRSPLGKSTPCLRVEQNREVAGYAKAETEMCQRKGLRGSPVRRYVPGSLRIEKNAIARVATCVERAARS